MDASELFSAISLFFSLVAVIISYKNLHNQKIHNIISVLPICQYFTKNYTDELAVELENKGKGQMQILQYTFRRNDDVVHEDLIDFVSDRDSCSYVNLGQGKVLSPGEVVQLISCKGLSGEQKDQLISELSNIEIDITYRDLYSNVHRLNGVIKFI